MTVERPRPRRVPWLAQELAAYLAARQQLHLHRGRSGGAVGRIVWYLVYDTPDAHMRLCGTNRCYRARMPVPGP